MEIEIREPETAKLEEDCICRKWGEDTASTPDCFRCNGLGYINTELGDRLIDFLTRRGLMVTKLPKSPLEPF